MNNAIVAGSIMIALDTATGHLPAMTRGLPTLIVSDLQRSEGVALWVLAGSTIKGPADLKGARVSVSAIGSAPHFYALLATRSLGIDKDLKFVGTRGIPEMLAALKTKAVEAVASYQFPIMELWVKGEVRPVLQIEEYLPKQWLAHVIIVRRDFIKSKGTEVRAVVKALLKANSFISREPVWAMEKMKELQSYSVEAAKRAYDSLRFSPDGKVNLQAVENVKNFLVDYGVITREKAPPVEELYTREFTG